MAAEKFFENLKNLLIFAPWGARLRCGKRIDKPLKICYNELLEAMGGTVSRKTCFGFGNGGVPDEKETHPAHSRDPS